MSFQPSLFRSSLVNQQLEDKKIAANMNSIFDKNYIGSLVKIVECFGGGPKMSESEVDAVPYTTYGKRPFVEFLKNFINEVCSFLIFYK